MAQTINGKGYVEGFVDAAQKRTDLIQVGYVTIMWAGSEFETEMGLTTWISKRAKAELDTVAQGNGNKYTTYEADEFLTGYQKGYEAAC